MCTRIPHKHAEVIKAWADGATIQFWDEFGNEWITVTSYSSWDKDTKYRIKPELKPDKEVYVESILFPKYSQGVYLIFDGETGDLKSAKQV